MKNILRQSWKIVVAVLGTAIGSLIVNSYTQWWGALANATNAGWEAVSQATVSAITYRLPIWTVVVAVALVALTWYATQKIGGAPKVSTPKASTPDFLAYDQDSFDGLFCRWDYSRTLDGPDYRIGQIVCYCQHCDFAIGTPNDHVQECPSCSRRAVKSENRPFRRGGYFGDAITGYQRRNNEMLFEDFIRREIERRIRTGEWQRSSNA